MTLKIDKKELVRKLNSLTYSDHYQFALTSIETIVLQDDDEWGDEGLEIVDPVGALRNLETATDEQRTHGFPGIVLDERKPVKASNVVFHPWELAGLGLAPFRFVELAELPPKSLLEANPDAYNNRMRDLPTEVGLGSCHYCGNGIRFNFIIESFDGKRFAVGSECVRKLNLKGSDDLKLENDVRRARLAKEREKREAKRLEKRREYEEKMRPIWEANRKEREAEMDRKEEERRLREIENAAGNAWIVEVLAKANRLGSSDFLQSFYGKLHQGSVRIDELSEKVTRILREIYGKTKSGKRVGSKDFEAAAAEFDKKLEEMRN